jgi:nucleolar protein 56
MNNQAFIIEAKERIKGKILKDNLIIFFTRVVEDLKNNDDPNLFGRVKDLYILIRPYNNYYDHEINKFLNSDFECKDGMMLDDLEMNYLRIFMKELKRDFHLKNPKVMKGRLNGILTKLCEKYFENSCELIEPFLLGKLIGSVGGVERLKDMPSSTIQLIGAEKALFRHVARKEKCPKYGLLYYSKFIQGEKNKGKFSRKLANKLAITIKTDYFRRL